MVGIAKTSPGLIGLPRRFEERFAETPRVFRAPGRVNLIGEHTDYNDGFVMPVAIQLSTWIAISQRRDDQLIVHSENYDETASRTGDAVSGWSRYVFGVAAVLERMGCQMRGANVLVNTEIPIGAGLSSSAALEVGVAYALLNISDITLDPTNVARACQRAEHEFAGVRCGLMDQMIACHGRAGHAMMLDTRDLNYEFVPLPPAVAIVVCNTMVKHDLSTAAYNTRRAECQAAAKSYGRSLRDVTLNDSLGNRRARHVVTENARVQSARDALNEGDVSRFGNLMGESHSSLRDDYEVSCRELDVMVDIASGLDGVYGARMTGGGFGGCTVNLVRADCVQEFTTQIAERYAEATGLRPDVYVCTASSAVQEETAQTPLLTQEGSD